jgi:mannose-6-phosphate isomerase-like protein (cupin superfamily)
MTLDQQFEAHGVTVAHHFGDHEYAKETIIPAGVWLAQHEHEYSHLSVLAQGLARVYVDGACTEHKGPVCMLIPAGKSHRVEAITDVVWYCLSGTDLKDPDLIDAHTKKKEH